MRTKIMAGLAAAVIVLMTAAYATAHGLSTPARSARKNVASVVTAHPLVTIRRAHHHAHVSVHTLPAVTPEPGSGSGDENGTDQEQSSGDSQGQDEQSGDQGQDEQSQDEQSQDEQSQDDQSESGQSDSGDEGSNNQGDDQGSGDQGSQDSGSQDGGSQGGD